MEFDITTTPVYAEIDMSTIVYAAFVALAFIVNQFNKAKKKQQQQKKQAPGTEPDVSRSPRNAGKTFEELLQEFTGNAPEPEQSPAPVVVERTQPRARPIPQPVNNPYQEALQKRLVQEKAASKTDSKKGLSRFDEFEDEEVVENDFAELLGDADSARKAFVLSEIFQRKY